MIASLHTTPVVVVAALAVATRQWRGQQLGDMRCAARIGDTAKTFDVSFPPRAEDLAPDPG